MIILNGIVTLTISLKSKEAVVFFLKVLKKYGAPTQDLLQFYCRCIMAWRINKFSKQQHRIERIQPTRVFRIILPDVNYIEALT